MKTVKVVDGAFLHARGCAFGGEAIMEEPELLRWDRTPGKARVKVWTDAHIPEAQAEPTRKKIALLLESPSVRKGMYEQTAPNLAHLFHAVLTHYQPLVEMGPPYLFYPLGGTRIRKEDWGLHQKSKDVSLIASAKVGQPGHRLRHRVAATFPQVDAYGEPYGGYVHSRVALRDYRYSVVIENCQANWYFSEKLIDCLSQGTVPIYWGGDVAPFFNAAGILTFQTLDELGSILNRFGRDEYEAMLPIIRENLRLAREYRCPEDWIMRHYLEIFDG